MWSRYLPVFLQFLICLSSEKTWQGVEDGSLMFYSFCHPKEKKGLLIV